MATSLIDLKKLSRDLNRITDNLKKLEDIATTRSLNAILKREEKAIAVDIAKEYGITQSAARKKMRSTKATKFKKAIAILFASTRTNLIKPKQLKRGGISFRAKGGAMVKITTNINGGTKPFLINAKAGGQTGGNDIAVPGGNKKIPVYKKAGSKSFTTMRGSSIAHMAEKTEITNERLLQRVMRDFPDEYRRQLKSAKYTGKR